MRRRTLVGCLLSLSVSGCLRLTNAEGTTAATTAGTGPESTAQDATGTAGETGTTPPSGVRATLSEPPEPFIVGLSQRTAVRVNNNRGEPFDGEVQLRVDGALRAFQSLALDPRSGTTVEFDLTLDALETRTVTLVVTGEDYEVVLFDDELAPAQHALTLEWGEAYVPSEAPDSDNPGDDRSLSFNCSELVLERDGEPLATYDIGVYDEEPRRIEGAYSPEEHDGVTRRWFGTPTRRTVIGFEDDLLAEADVARFVGELPPEPRQMPVTVRVGERTTHEALWPKTRNEHVVPVEVDG